MARPLRIEFSGALYQVTLRGDRRETIFEDDEDRLRCSFGNDGKNYSRANATKRYLTITRDPDTIVIPEVRNSGCRLAFKNVPLKK